MTQETNRLTQLLEEMENLFSTHSIVDFDVKPFDSAWSKKEILGHLIDSALNNIQRFTEIQYSEKPYQVRKYNPDELVKANNYKYKDNGDLFQLWLHLNKQISFIMHNQTQTALQYSIILPDGQPKDLRFLLIDYIEHLEHHLNQIKS
ncbi:DinB family protein [Flavobacterium sp. LS2P90]|uniref:DinB family protein n=1 Tax=Flavobacterium xylosi TaxID=3230415 RepID=A0ABW6HVZ5_9FLAO